MSKRFLYSLFLIAISLEQLPAQSYVTAAGLRAGTELGITVQQRMYKTTTLEAIATTNRYRWQVQTLYEYHRKFLGKRFNYYIGIGPHFGNEKGYGNYWGITPITGVEATLAGLCISWDYKPSLNMGGGSSLFFHDSGLSLRYVFIKQPRKRPFRDLIDKISNDE